MILAHAKRNQKLRSVWRGPMKVVDFKSSLAFIVEDVAARKSLTVHARRATPYLAAPFGERASQKLKAQIGTL